MLKRLNHIAIVVPDVKKAKEIYKQNFNAVVSDPKSYPEQGVTVVFVELENTKIELMEPYGKNSPIIKFLEKNPDGGMHHICLEVSDINKSLENLNEIKFEKIGYPLLFLPFVSRASEVVGKRLFLKLDDREILLNFNNNI